MRPALVTLYEGGERMWLNDPERVAVADALGYDLTALEDVLA